MKEFIRENRKIIVVAVFVFSLFAICTYLTPLAGDDWGYALNGMKENPFVMAAQFYQTWSGRFFSELWGFVIAPNKWAWNILNPVLFTVIFLCINLISNPERKFGHAILTFMMMLFVSAYLRMETYTWIMGTTYIVPLCLSFVFFCFVYGHLGEKTWKKIEVLICSFLSFYIGLCMENIAGVMILANLILLITAWIKKKDWKTYVVFLLMSSISFAILRCSPGSSYRLSENIAWLEMNFFEQICSNLPSFFTYTFYDNKYLVGTLVWLLFFVVLQKEQYRLSKWTVASFVMAVLSVFFLLSNKVYSLTHIELFNLIMSFDANLLALFTNLVFWCGFIVYLFIALFFLLKGNKLEIAIFFLLLAGASNLVMLVSPIFGSRSSVYFYYFAIVLVLLVFDELKLSKTVAALLCSLFVLLSAYRGIDTVKRYVMVDRVHQDRLIKIQYYLDHPEEKDVWLPRMPIYTVHGADIEVDDTYHMSVFKQYFGLSEECVLHFYIEE